MLRLRTLLGAIACVAALAVGGCGGDDDSASAAAASLGGNRIHQLYEQLSPGVVFIQAQIERVQRSPFGPQRRQGVATGTGFAYDGEGHIVTNAHVVEGANKVALRVEGDRLVPAQVVGADLSTDLAVLHVDPGDFDAQPLTLGDSADVEVGDPVLAIGNPFGLEDTITSGIVSARHRIITAPNGYAIDDVIQTDAAVNPGNSGGPLVDADGKVVGVNSQIATGGQTNAFAGIAFAIPSATVEEIVPDLIDDGRVQRPFLGVSTVDVTPSIAAQLQLSADHGAYVVAVADGSPADEAGIHAAGGSGGALLAGGDVIVSLAGTDIAGSDDVARAILDHDIGDRVRIEVMRGGERRTLTAELGTRPGSE
ncbi:MAG TPA: trypsin-like peptidase domain-containing protein [Solirubrobacteraceae bacterium]|nr:trypsin-like peptidase domain-containing protein [Solirubrobacteraceae bacterium]